MPPLRGVTALEDLSAAAIVSVLWLLGCETAGLSAALALCFELRQQLPPPLLQLLADGLYRRGEDNPPPSPTHAAAAYLLGGRRARLSPEDLPVVAQLSAPPGGGPRALTVAAATWTAPERQPRTEWALGKVLTSFSNLVSLQLDSCATNRQLAAVGSCCRQLVKLVVELAMVDDSGVWQMLGLPDSMEESLLMAHRGVALRPANLSSLREITLEDTMVGVSGHVLLLEALPQLRVCRVSGVDPGEVLDAVFGSDPESRRAMTPCYQLRRLECRYPLSSAQAEAVARCCRRLQHLCLRGRGSSRNDLMLLHWFTSLTDLTSLELINIHPAALAEFLGQVGPRLTSLHLLETSRWAVSLFSGSPSLHLWSALRLCPGLTSLRVTPPDVAQLTPPRPPVKLQVLTSLVIDGAPVAGLVPCLLSAAPRLQELEMAPRAEGFTDAAVATVMAEEGLRQLRRLHLSDCELSAAGLQMLLSHCTQLHALTGLPEAKSRDLHRRATEQNWSLELS